MMTKISFQAWRSGHYVGLAELLGVLGPHALDLQWKLHLEEVAPHPKARALEAVAEPLGTPALLQLLTPDVQIIDGELRASRAGAHVLVLRAVDGTSWDAESSDPELLGALRQRFPEAVDLPE
ncbi:hypothetical protein HMI49_39995 [Corallococcus exercitus]|uniref:Uncharacterized protein n=1 Tax=Corallococcus exercitus TaxID=2316736 RepID=A0A7Y4KSV6_9BACT|nr:hypothetical protein [Corallococcus exercitus]NOK39371.1 hypothetical protein [Corallococcus exercitus]